MTFLTEFVTGVPLPRMYRMRQHFDAVRVDDVAGAVCAQLEQADGLRSLTGLSIGVAVGSRGISDIATVVRTVVSWVKERGGLPFIVPAMGSHGGATPAGQTGVLSHLGVTQELVGAPIRASMVTHVVGESYDHPVHCSEVALRADHLIIVNRIKPHTAFRGARESGLTKMIAIGLGKRDGAEALHGLGMHRFADTIPAFAATILSHAPPVTGLALVENAHHQICHIETVPARALGSREPELLLLARQNMPRFYVDRFDVLVVGRIGKNISGDGMDPNITGRYPVSHVTGGPAINKIVVLGLTPETAGNANGIGLADFTTQALIAATDWDLTTVNALSGMTTTTIKQPLAAASPEQAVKAAIKTSTAHPDDVALVAIRNTLDLTDILVSEALVEQLGASGRVEIVAGPVEHDWNAP